MLIFYTDGSGDHSMTTETDMTAPTLRHGTSEYFILSAVGIHDSSRKPLAEALAEIKKRHFGPSLEEQPWGATELKGRNISLAARRTGLLSGLDLSRRNRCSQPPATRCR